MLECKECKSVSDWEALVDERVSLLYPIGSAADRFESGLIYKHRKGIKKGTPMRPLIQIARNANVSLSYVLGLTDERGSYTPVSTDAYAMNLPYLIRKAGYKSLREFITSLGILNGKRSISYRSTPKSHTIYTLHR